MRKDTSEALCKHYMIITSAITDQNWSVDAGTNHLFFRALIAIASSFHFDGSCQELLDMDTKGHRTAISAHMHIDEAASLCRRPRVPAADGPVYALWPSGYGSAVHKGLLLLLCMLTLPEASEAGAAVPHYLLLHHLGMTSSFSVKSSI
jgi:hypothetical protein